MNPKAVIEKWVEGWNRQDAESIASLYHNDAVNLQMAIGVPLLGKEAILNDLKDFFKRIPDNHTIPMNIFEDGEWAILEWEGGGTFHNDNGEQKPFTLQGCGFFHVIDGKIKFQRGYWDKHTWFSQVGLPTE